MSDQIENTTTTETTPTEPTAEEKQRLDLEDVNMNRIGDCIKTCDGYAKNCHQLCEFLAAHGTRLVGLNWGASHIYLEVTIQVGGYGCAQYEQDARKIARRFPGVVWRRVKDDYTCGVLNWKAEFAGMKMEIKHAEKIRWTPEPNTEVDPNGPAPAVVEEAQP